MQLEFITIVITGKKNKRHTLRMFLLLFFIIYYNWMMTQNMIIIKDKKVTYV